MWGEAKNKYSSWLRLESETACHVLGDREPRRDRLDLLEASDHELPQAAIACLGVDALRRRGSLLVDLLGLSRPHSLSPSRHFFTVGRFRLMPIHRSLPR